MARIQLRFSDLTADMKHIQPGYRDVPFFFFAMGVLNFAPMISALDRVFYPTYLDNWDDWLLRERIRSLLSPSDVILDLGAGSGKVKQMDFRGLCGRVCGLDPVPEVLQNRYLDEAKIGGAEVIPWPAETFDLVFSDNVLEHLPNPQVVFDEVFRVLKPTGYFVFKTPNRFHYVTMASALLHHRLHEIINKWRGRSESDTFPTLYRANSERALTRLGRKFSSVSIDAIEGRPQYTRSGPLAVLYPIGLFWERIVNSSELFTKFRVILIGTLTK